MWYLFKNSQAVKMGTALCRMKKSCKIQVAAKKIAVMVGQWQKF